MIVRQWRGWAQREQAAKYLQYFETKVQPALRTVQGYQKALVVTREQGEETEIVTMTFFARLENVAAFAGDQYELANVSPEAQKLLSHYEKTVSHYEVALDLEER
jgi:antibiotic biosynthesis monooxygenase (ABM) superfamily enzyme